MLVAAVTLIFPGSRNARRMGVVTLVKKKKGGRWLRPGSCQQRHSFVIRDKVICLVTDNGLYGSICLRAMYTGGNRKGSVAEKTSWNEMINKDKSCTVVHRSATCEVKYISTSAKPTCT
jgi:hypothetical protein